MQSEPDGSRSESKRSQQRRKVEGYKDRRSQRGLETGVVNVTERPGRREAAVSFAD